MGLDLYICCNCEEPITGYDTSSCILSTIDDYHEHDQITCDRCQDVIEVNGKKYNVCRSSVQPDWDKDEKLLQLLKEDHKDIYENLLSKVDALWEKHKNIITTKTKKLIQKNIGKLEKKKEEKKPEKRDPKTEAKEKLIK
jgi:hypothetical protein